MKVRIDVVNGDSGQVVSIRIAGAEADEVRRLLGGPERIGSPARRQGRIRGSTSTATPEMVARGVAAFIARGDEARLGAALAEVWRAMEEVRSAARESGGDD